jgi:hypothetical protein
VAALAHEQALQEAFAAGKDVHEATARVLLGRQPGVSACCGASAACILWMSISASMTACVSVI